MGRHCLVATMKILLLVFVISSAAALETYTETRDITDSAGTTFSCLYTIVYDPSRKVVYRKQSSVKCDPDTNGSLKPSNKVSKVALRQLFNGGLLGQLAAPATDGGTNIMEDMAMNMVQQQIEQMLASGELETMAMEFMSSGQMEQMIQDFMADPATQQMINDMLEEMMRPPTEEEAAMIMSMMEELLKPPTEEEMAEMEQAWTEMMSSVMSEEEMAQMEQAWNDWEAQMEAEWQANGGLMGMMGMTGEDLQKMMQMMEMKAHCQCTASDVAYGQMAMPTMTAAGRK